MDYVSTENLSNILSKLKQISPNVFEIMNGSLPDISNNIDNMLSKHKKCVEEQIKKHGDYIDIGLNEREKALQRERVLKKYVWVMKYHNDMCCRYNKMQYFINSTANCDAKFMLLKVNVL